MVLPLLACLAGRWQGSLQELKFKMPEPVFAEQREVVLGPLPYADTMMSMIYSKDKPATFDTKGINPPIWDEYPIGSVRWWVKPDTFGSQPCMVLRIEASYRPQYRFDFKGHTRQTQVTLEVRGISQWWLAKDGTILRQYEQRTSDRGVRVANCTYGADSIEVAVDDMGRRRVTTLYPGEMDKVQAQFKPMIVDGKVVLREKEYLVYNPFTSGFERHTAKVSGSFKGDYMSLKFEGNHVDIDGFEDGAFKAYISVEGDLVKVDLPKNRFVVMQVTPPGKEKKDGGSLR